MFCTGTCHSKIILYNIFIKTYSNITRKNKTLTCCIDTYMSYMIYHRYHRFNYILWTLRRTYYSPRQVGAWLASWSYFLARVNVKHYNKYVIKNSFPRFSVILNVLIYYDDMTSGCIQVSILSLFPCR